MSNNNWSPFYPTIFYPEQQQVVLARSIDERLKDIAKNQNTQVIIKDFNNNNELINKIGQEISFSSNQICNAIDGLSETFAWNLGLIHTELMEQTKFIIDINNKLDTPTERKSKEFLKSGQELADKWIK